MKRAYYDVKPSVLEATGNGGNIYRWDIKEEQVGTTEGMEQSERVQHSCYEVVVWNPVSSNKILQEVMVAKYPNNREQKYINEYNAAILGVYKDDEAKEKIQAYTEFLVERDRLKAQVDSDCAELGVI